MNLQAEPWKEEGMETRCQQFKNIVTISGIESKQLANLLFELRGVFGSSFDFIEPLISGREIKTKRDIKSSLYVSMKYQKARSWKHEKVWLEEEEDNYDKYHEFSAMTKKFLSGDGSLLISILYIASVALIICPISISPWAAFGSGIKNLVKNNKIKVIIEFFLAFLLLITAILIVIE